MDEKKTKVLCELLKQSILSNEYVQFLGMEIVELRQGYCKGKMPITNRIKNPYGTMHGGSLYSFADIISGLAACSYGKAAVTVDGSMNFLLPAEKMDYIYCEAQVIKQGKTLAVYDVKILGENNEVFDSATFTFFITDTDFTKMV